MKIIFFGTPEYVIPILSALYKKYTRKSLVAVVTQSPKKGNRGKLTYSAVDTWAYKHHLPIITDLRNLTQKPIIGDVGILAAYGQIIPNEVINLFRYGILNIHPSLLPQFRGASPVQATILTGTNPTGVTVLKIDDQLDHGPIVSQFKEEVREEDTTESLRKRLFERSAQFLIGLIPNYLNGKIKLKEQDHRKATYSHLIKKENAYIEPEDVSQAIMGEKIKDDAVALERFIRAMNPWPLTWSRVKLGNSHHGPSLVKRLKILKVHLEGKKLILDEVQLEGKNPVSWEEFKHGYPDATF